MERPGRPCRDGTARRLLTPDTVAHPLSYKPGSTTPELCSRTGTIVLKSECDANLKDIAVEFITALVRNPLAVTVAGRQACRVRQGTGKPEPGKHRVVGITGADEISMGHAGVRLQR